MSEVIDPPEDDPEKKDNKPIDPSFVARLNPYSHSEDLERRLTEMMMEGVRESIRHVQEQQTKFLEASDIERIAKLEAVQLLKDIGIPMESLGETNAQITWLLGIRKGTLWFVWTFVGMVGSSAFGLVWSWMTSGKK